MSVEQFLEIMDDTSTEMPSSAFHEVSDLSPEEMGQFARAWLDISEERQLEIVSTMAQLAEENAELDFNAVFKMCLRISDDDVLEAAIEGLWEHEDRSIIPALVEGAPNRPRVLAYGLRRLSGWASSLCSPKRASSWPRMESWSTTA